MRKGTVIHAVSTGPLPYTCAGSVSSSFARRRKRTTAYTSKPATTMKIAAVITSTKPARCEIAWAGADSGAKMLGTNLGFVVSAGTVCWIKQNAATQNSNGEARLIARVSHAPWHEAVVPVSWASGQRIRSSFGNK